MSNLVNFILSLIFLVLGVIELVCFLFAPFIDGGLQFDKLLLGGMSLVMAYVLIKEIKYDNHE